MVANLGCEMAQMGLASPADIDTAMRLGLNYPAGPLALADKIGVERTYEILRRLQEITGSDRYRPSPWLRRRALLGLPAATPA
jgi:3-hydroxybutyryl-CoA dehydrogenase